VTRKPILFLSFALALFPPLAHATWYGENVERGADIMMMDIRWPWWAETTYCANWNFGTVPDGVSAYGGFAGSVPTLPPDHRPNLDPEVQAAFRPGSVWSFWGSNAQGEPVRVVAASQHTFAYQYIGEGASGALFGTWPVIEQNRWYTMMMRIWTPFGEKEPKVSYIGRWVKDVEADRWYLYGVMRLPIAATAFNGNAGFLEDFGNVCRSARSIHRRLGYYRKDGRWHKSDTVTINVQKGLTLKNYWVVNKIDDGHAVAMELSSNRAMVPQLLKGEPLAEGKKHAFTVQQPEMPTLDRPKVERLQAQFNGKQVLVCWEVPDSASPQYHYKVEVFDNPQCTGQPVAVREARMPITRNVVLAAEVSNPAVRFSMTDVFDQRIGPVVVQASKAAPPTNAVVVKTAPGLQYELRVKDTDRHVNVIYPPCEKAEQSRNERHIWVSLDELKDGRLIQQGICRGLDIELRDKRRTGYAFRFRGLLRAARPGFYLFYMKGTDGYRIQLDGRDVLVWDGLHGPEEKTASLHLAKGDHPLAIDYFVDRNKPFFQLQWEGPGLARQDIPPSVLLHQAGETIPESALLVEADDRGSVNAQVNVNPRGHTIEKIHFFFDKMQISSANGDSLQYTGVLPAGEHKVWARVQYDGNHTIDTEVVPVTVAMKELSGWDLGIAGESKSTFNILQTAADAFSFVGEGEYVVSRPMEGDFTLTCKIDQCLGLHGEPVNGSSWVGLTARERPERNNYRWGPEFGLMQVANNGLRTTPDHGDGAGTRQSYQRLTDGHPWLRIVRQGNLFSAWTSADGRQWRFGTAHHKRIAPKVGAGIVFRALPQDAQMYFRASVSGVSLTAGAAKDFDLPVEAATGTESARITGVVVALSSPQVVVVRTTDRGLLRSEDGGRTWNHANGKLKGTANAVRSVAIHPGDPNVMLRAAGRVDVQGRFDGGLYRTANGGGSWERLNVPCDFDGVGPSALCGEVVAFLPSVPKTILVGSETRGLYRSEDGGETFKEVLPAGHRFTALHVNPNFQNEFGHTVIHAVTCPDRFLPLLGRGKPALTARENNAVDFVSYDNGRTFRAETSRTDLGYLNALALRCAPSHWLYGTTHGLLFSFSQGFDSYLYATSLPVESMRPLTALGGSIAGSQLCTRKFVQALQPEVPRRISRCDLGGDVWSWTNCKGEFPKRILAIQGADPTRSSTGENWWILGDDGLYRSDDRCETFRKTMGPVAN